MSPEFSTISPGRISPPPSRQWAWMLAVIATGGNIHRGDRTDQLSFTSYDQGLLRYFRETGESLLRISSSCSTLRVSRDGMPYQMAYFCRRGLSEVLGDLKRNSFPQTILNHHSWILANPNHTWGFIEGMFETSGNVIVRPTNSHKLHIYTDYTNVANFTSDVLYSAGIHRLQIIQRQAASQGIHGVQISNITDIKTIADHIQSHDLEKEKKLEYYRSLTSDYLAGLAGLARAASDQECIEEWQRIRAILGHTPRQHEINALRKQRKTPFSSGPYQTRFGQGSFVRAREEIERIIEEGNN